MAKKRPGVMLYFDWLPALQSLTCEEQGQLLMAVLTYAQTGQIPNFHDRTMIFAWAAIQPHIDADEQRYAEVVEKLAGKQASKALNLERMIAIELERIAMHLADTGALATDIGFQLFQVACEALRTVTINTSQAWCGNRFGKSVIRPVRQKGCKQS